MTCEMCGESLPLHDVFNHVRVMHPDQWDERMPNWPVEVHVHIEPKPSEKDLIDAIRRGMQYRPRGLG